MNTRGKVFKYPDNVDTDVIIPARYLNTPDANELAMHCMEDMKLPEGKSVSFKNELLFSRGINFDKLPALQKRGVEVYWADIEKAEYSVTALNRLRLCDII